MADRDTAPLMFVPDPGRPLRRRAPAGGRDGEGDGELVFRHQLSLSPDELGRLIRSCEVAADVWDDSGDVEELEAVQELVLRLRKSEVLVS